MPRRVSSPTAGFVVRPRARPDAVRRDQHRRVGDSHVRCVKGSPVLDNDDTNEHTSATDPGSPPDAVAANEAPSPEADAPVKKAAKKTTAKKATAKKAAAKKTTAKKAAKATRTTEAATGGESPANPAADLPEKPKKKAASRKKAASAAAETPPEA